MVHTYLIPHDNREKTILALGMQKRCKVVMRSNGHLVESETELTELRGFEYTPPPPPKPAKRKAPPVKKKAAKKPPKKKAAKKPAAKKKRGKR